MVAMNDEQVLIDALLGAHADHLIWEFRHSLAAREVLNAMTRARITVRDGYRDTALELPPAQEYASLIVGITRRLLRERFGPAVATTHEHPAGA